jgi:hypothetical protein
MYYEALMDLIPVSRIAMQARRAAKIEADRQHFVKQTIETIYKAALNEADGSTMYKAAGDTETTSYKYIVSCAPRIFQKTLAGLNQLDVHGTMIFNNYVEIIEKLRILFPDCYVTYMSQIQDSKGIWHEVSSVTEALMPFITRNARDVILIDWA